jgi:hypothetical protein
MNKDRIRYGACGPFLFTLLLTACAEDTRPSADESAQMNEAEAALNSAPDALSDIDANALGESSNAAEAIE